jgi:hypothetical protein
MFTSSLYLKDSMYISFLCIEDCNLLKSGAFQIGCRNIWRWWKAKKSLALCYESQQNISKEIAQKYLE